MVDFHMEKLTELATGFRAAIDALVRHDRKALSITFEQFPRGSCGDAAYLLAKYLEQHECGQFYYVRGRRGDKSHAWLEREELIVDITADQFEDQDRVVIVTKDHSWHSQFDDRRRHIADFWQYDKTDRDRLQALYDCIVAQIQSPTIR
jgi:hypothetical protein